MTRSILFVDHVSGVGGAEKSLLRLTKNLNPNHWTTYLICPEGKLADLARKQGLIVFTHEFPRLRKNVKSLWSIVNTIRFIQKTAANINAWVLHSNTIRSSFYTALASIGTSYHFIWHMRDFWLSEDKPKFIWFDTLLKKILYRLSSYVVVNSYATAKHLPYQYKTHVVHNGIEINNSLNFNQDEARKTFRESYKISNNTVVIGMIGRLRPWKGQHRFVEIAYLLHAQYPEVKFLIVGGNPFNNSDDFATSLQNQIIQRNLQDCIICTGQLDNANSALCAIDIFVHPGNPEPFGLVNIEAMAVRKPVVAFAHGALPEIVIDRVTGILVTPYDLQEMSQKIEVLINNNFLCRKLGESGRERVVEYFSEDKTVSKIENIYRNLIIESTDWR